MVEYLKADAEKPTRLDELVKLNLEAANTVKKQAWEQINQTPAATHEDLVGAGNYFVLA